MNRSVYRTLLRIVGIVLALVGVAAVFGGVFAHSNVTDQLKKEAISMPTADQVTNLPQASQDALKPFFNKEMTTGTEARAFADHYIWNHMQASCKTVKAADGTALDAVPAEQCNYAGVGDVATANKSDQTKYTAYTTLRGTLLTGETLRGMLLTSYAFWLIGTVAVFAGWALVAIGIVLALVGFVGLRGPGKSAGGAATPAGQTATA